MRTLRSLIIVACLISLGCGETSTEMAQVRIDIQTPAASASSDLVIPPTGVLDPLSPEVDFTADRPSTIRIHRVWVDATITYNENGRSDTISKSGEGQLIFGKQRVTIAFPETRGGTVTYIGHVTFQQRGYPVETKHSQPKSQKIIGLQPLKDNIRKYVADDLFSVVIFRRSAFEQFDVQGNPIFNNGFGLFRIPTPSAEQIWNWTKNVDFAKQDLEQRKTAANEIPARLRADDPVKYEGLPDFDKDQLLLMAVQSYGTGQYYKPEKSILTRKWKWVKDTNNDGFASKCEAIAKEVASGKFPPGWN